MAIFLTKSAIITFMASKMVYFTKMAFLSFRSGSSNRSRRSASKSVLLHQPHLEDQQKHEDDIIAEGTIIWGLEFPSEAH